MKLNYYGGAFNLITAFNMILIGGWFESALNFAAAAMQLWIYFNYEEPTK